MPYARNVLPFPGSATDPTFPGAVNESRRGNVVPLDARRRQPGGCRRALAAPASAPALSVARAPAMISRDGLRPEHIRSALAEDRLVVHYQPQFELRTGRIVAVEALVRITGDDGELVLPERFIAHAEASALIVPLGRAVIEQVCRDLAGWRAAGLMLERVAVNLSAHQLCADAGLAGFVAETLASNGLRHSDLEFELTERQALDAGGTGVKSLLALEAAGARLALDDFGIGYSSLSYLTSLPIRTVKLDRCLVQRLPEDSATARIVHHLTAMAEDLGLQMVAEGIESPAQRDHLTRTGCHLGQGFLVARPLSPERLTQLLREGARRSGGQ